MRHRRPLSFFQMDRLFIFLSLPLALVMAVSFFLGGCASTKETTAVFTPVTFEPAKAVVYIYRKSRFVGAVNTAEIFINNQHAGKLVNGSYCTHIAEPGRIEIKALEKVPAVFVLAAVISKLAGKQPIYGFTAEPGQEYFLEFNVAGYKVKQVSKDKALGMMGGLEPAKVQAD